MNGDKSQPSIVCQNVIKMYGSGNAEVHALRGVDLDVYPGEITMLVGPSGCGKTTLLSVVAGILRADERKRGCARHRIDEAKFMAANRFSSTERRLRVPAIQFAAGAHGGGKCLGAARDSRLFEAGRVGAVERITHQNGHG